MLTDSGRRFGPEGPSVHRPLNALYDFSRDSFRLFASSDYKSLLGPLRPCSHVE